MGRLSVALFSSDRKGLHLTRADLIPKLRSNFAEFLPEDSLTRLRILSLPTCVGLRYGRPLDWLRGFSWQHGFNQLPLIQGLGALSALSVNGPVDLPARPAYDLRPALPFAGWFILLRHPFAHNVQRAVQEY